MCRSRFPNIRLPVSVCLSGLLGLLSSAIGNAQVVNDCTAELAGGCNIDKSVVHIGDTITVTKVSASSNAAVPDCDEANVSGFLMLPSGRNPVTDALPVFTQGVIPSGACVTCPASVSCAALGGSAVCAPSFTGVTYVVNTADIGQPLTLDMTAPDGSVQELKNSGVPYHVQFLPGAVGQVPPGGNASGNVAKGGGQAKALVITPCISITKLCDQACFPYGTPISFHGTVSNCAAPIPSSAGAGSATGNNLFNIVVNDTLPAGATVVTAITFDTTTALGHSFPDAVNGLIPGDSVNYHGSYMPAPDANGNVCGPYTDTVTASATDVLGAPVISTAAHYTTADGITYTQVPGQDPQSAICHVSTSPSITISKACGAATPVGTPPGSQTLNVGAQYKDFFTVKNTGDVPLTGIVITDNVVTFGVPSTITIPVLGTLAPGASITAETAPTTIPQPTQQPCTIVDTATVTANSVCPGPDSCQPVTSVSNGPTAGCTITVLTTPGLGVSKTCTAPTAAGKPISFSGSVQNTGTTPINNVTVSDFDDLTGKTVQLTLTSDAAGTIPLTPPVTLAGGASAFFSGTIATTAADCNKTVTDTVTANATDVCQGPLAPQTASCKALIPPCPPHLMVFKEVLCTPSGGCTAGSFPSTATYTCAANNGSGAPLHSATGIEVGTTEPTFCYRLTVINDGQQDVLITGVSDSLSAIGLCSDVANLLNTTMKVGTTASCIIPNVALAAGTYQNTLTITAQGALDSVPLVTGVNGCLSDTATVTVKQINIECTKTASSTSGFVSTGDGTANLVLINTGTPAPVTYSVTITKTGDADVQFSSITINDPILAALAGQNGTSCPLPITLDASNNANLLAQINAGTATTVPLCTVDLLCSQLPLANTVTVTGTPSSTLTDQTAPACLPPSNNGQQATASSTCSANVSCVAAVSCRVTGGGRLDPGLPIDTSSCPVPPASFTGDACLGGAPLYTTHGGQLGAPYANPSCGNVAANPLGDPCIRGQWEHVRHFGGNHNPQSIVSVDNFHSNTPLGIYDMVQCACLPCCENPPPTGPTGILGNLCNPGDHKICGPEPRPAPDNAIIFTGVGYLRDCVQSNQKNSKPIPVLFRVYVVDRSEPGGGFPGGGNNPPDVYIIQVWSLPTPVTGEDPITGSAAIAARQTLATDSCNFIKSALVNTVPGSTEALPLSSDLPNLLFSDGGGLNKGNQQIHPSTSATCP